MDSHLSPQKNGNIYDDDTGKPPVQRTPCHTQREDILFPYLLISESTGLNVLLLLTKGFTNMVR